MKGTQIAGGTNPDKDLTEKKVILKFQHCEDYMTDTSDCATIDEENAFFETVEFNILLADNYVDFSQVETEESVKQRFYTVVRWGAKYTRFDHVHSIVELKASEATFYDR